MARLKEPIFFRLVVTTIIVSAIVAEIHADKCRTGCMGVTPNIFKYQEGTTYKYNLEGNIDVALSSAEGQQSTTKIRGTVLLTQQPNCNQILRLQNVQVIGPDTKKYGGLANVEKPIRLNFHDGHLEDEICTEPGDTQNSLNIKRAVASMFQAALKSDKESDVFGDCPNEISSRKEGANLIIQKSRNLNKCNHRESIKQDFMATSFNLNSEIKSCPLLTSDYESEQRVKNGILDYALVTENYLYLPFSNGKNQGAKATVTTKLTLAGQNKEKVTVKCTEPRSIHFENPHQETTKTANVDNILNALKETKKTMDISVTEKSAGTFAQLIRVLRASKKNDILAVYSQVKSGAGGFKDKDGARKVFFDALFRTGTGEAVEVIVELLRNKELSPMEHKLVYLSLAFIRHASKGSLSSAATLLDQPNIPREAYLGVGTLAGRFCREHSCTNVDELNKLMQKLATKLTSQPANRIAENEVLAVLKGLGNVKHLTDNIVDKLVQIANDKKAPARLRVAALETALSDACKPKLINAALNLMKNRQEDSEIRIKAYLVAVECPDNKVAAAVKELIEHEPVYQVGGYIVSHLRNLRSSVNPDKQHAKHVMKDVKTKVHYPIDPRKFSFNTELSYNFDTLGSGSSVESDVIYSQTSFLPRSTSLNLTTELLGHSFNFLEVGVRQENLDKVLEHYFGPLGVLNTHSAEELISSGTKSAEKLTEHIKERLAKSRSKRDVSKSEIEAFAKQIKILGSEFNKDLDLDLSVKLFGSELLFLSLNEDIQELTPEAVVDKLFDCLDAGLDKAKNFEYHLKNHILFLDTELSFPTSMGFPLRLTLEGSSAMHFITSGNIDIRQILADPKNAQLKLSVIPSTNIEISAYMTLDAHLIKSGLKVTSNILTSTGTDISLKMLDNKGIDVKVGLPVEKQTIISFNHAILFSSQELGKPEVDVPLKFKDKLKDFSFCFDQLIPLTGLEFCAEMDYPSTLATNQVSFPLNGNVKLGVSIVRSDVTEYHFKALVDSPNPHSKSLEITFNTPNSETDRHVNLLLEATALPNKALRATIKSPLKTAIAETVLTDNAEEKSLMGRFQYDNMEYYGKIGVAVKGTDAKQIYKPLIEYHTPNDIVKTKGSRKPDYTVEGQIVVEKQGDLRKFIFDHVKLISPGQPPIAIDGYLARERHNSYSGDVKVSRDSMKVGLSGKIEAEPNQIKVNAQFENSVNPNANFKLDYESKNDQHKIETDLSLTHGPDLTSKTNCFSISETIKYNYQDKDHFEIGTKHKLSYPLLSLGGKLDTEITNKLISYDLEFKYDKFKIESELDAKFATKHTNDYDIKFEIEVLNNNVQLVARRDIVGEKSNIHNLLNLSGRKYQLDGTVIHHMEPNDINIGADLIIKVAEKPDAIKINTGLIANPHSLDSHAQVIFGNNVLIDIAVKGVRGDNPNGNLKVVIANVINANGQFKVMAGKGSGSIVIELPTIDRKLKAESTFTVQEPTYSAVVNVFFDFEKDNTNKLHLETNNEITKNSFDSKNKLQLLSYTMEANARGKIQGDLENGEMEGEFDAILPNKNYIAGKIVRVLHLVDSVGTGHIQINVEHRDTKESRPRRIELKGDAKDIDMKRNNIDIIYHLLAESAHGKNVLADLAVKHKVIESGAEELHDSLVKLKVYGNVLPNTLETEVSGQYNDAGQYKALVKYGPSLAAILTGKYDLHGGDKPLSGEAELELITANEKLKNLKLKTGGKIVIPENEDGFYEIEGYTSGILNNEQTAKVEGHYKGTDNQAEMKVSFSLPEEDPLSLGGGYKYQKTETGCKCEGHVDIAYGKGKEVKLAGALEKISEDEYNADIRILSPNEAAKDVHLQYKYKDSNNNQRYNEEAILTVDGKKYTLTNYLEISELHPSFELKLVYPDGEVSRIYARLDKLSEAKYKGETSIESVGDFNLVANGEVNLESIDNFHILINVDSEKLKLHKIKAEASNKPAKGGKKIVFSVKSADKNILSGSTNYKANQEAGKLIVEGSGSVKVKDETKTATFKFIRQELEQQKDGEHGIEMLLNAGVGSQAIVSEWKLTNKQFRLMNSYCEEKKQCAHVEIFSKTSTPGVKDFNHELEINIDLRKLGLSHEFGLKAVTNRKELVLDHTVDIHFESSANSKYQYSVYIHPKEAGIQFTTPKRIISLESHGDVTLPKGNKVGPIKGEISLYMDKKHEPNKKSSLSYSYVQEGDDKTGKIDSEVRLSSPGLSKDLFVLYRGKYDMPAKSADGYLEIDIFAKKNQKITLFSSLRTEKTANGYKVIEESSAVSKGLNIDIKSTEQATIEPQNIDYEYKVLYQVDKAKQNLDVIFKLNPKHFELLADLCHKKLLHIDAHMDIEKNSQVVDTNISGVGIDDLVTHSEVKNFNTFIYTVAKKAAPQNKLQISAGLILGQIADFRAEIIKGTEKLNLIFATVKLDDANFLKPDFDVNMDNIQNILLVALEKEHAKGIEDIRVTSNEYEKVASAEMQKLLELGMKNAPNVKPVVQYYQQELTKLKEELISDKTIAEASELLKKIYESIAVTVIDIFTKLEELGNKFIALSIETYSKLADTLIKDVLPPLKATSEKLLNIYLSIMKDIYDLVMIYLVKVSELLKAHQAELKQLATVVSEALEDFGRLFIKFFTSIGKDIERIATNLYEQVNALPIFEELGERYQELVQALPLPEQILNIINELCGTFKDLLPTEELKHFVSLIQDYLGKKIRKEELDDLEALHKIYDSLVDAISSLISQLEAYYAHPEEFEKVLENALPIPFDSFTKLPQLAAVKMSWLNLLTSGDLPSDDSLLHEFSLNPRDVIPPFPLHGVVAQGQHIFTFDDKHLTFPGKCSYVLAKDVVNGNFTIVGSYKDGHLESLSFYDKHDVVTISRDEKYTLNGKNTELPVRNDHVQVFRLYDSVQLVSKAGVFLACEPNLNICGFHVSGYYHGQLRGLLGNGNYEPYDDFIMANGKITTSESDFGNSFKMNAACEAVKTVDHSMHHTTHAPNPKCSKLFSKDASFSLCYPFVDPQGYKQACQHGVEAGIPDTEKYIAAAYVVACWRHYIPVSMPKEYVECKNGPKPVTLGDKFSVTVPSKSADIVIVVEQNKQNEVVFKDLVQPAVTQLTNELAAKGITDVQYSLIGYGGDFPEYPSHYTSGGKLAFHDKSALLKFTEVQPKKPVSTGCDKLDELLHALEKYLDITMAHLGLVPEYDAAREAFMYPFRADAVKSIIVVSGQPHSDFKPLLHLRRYIAQLGGRTSIHLNLIAPFEDLKLSGKEAKQVKNLVGFNQRTVYTLSDAKKKGEGSAELRKDLDYGLDYRVGYILEKSDGNVFASNNFVQAKGGQRKQFVQVVSHAIADQLTRTSQQLDCQCKQFGYFQWQNMCKLVSIREKEQLQAIKKGGTKG